MTLKNVGLNPTRTALIDVLREMGAGIDAIITGDAGGEPVGDITVQSAAGLEAISIGPDSVPALIDELPLHRRRDGRRRWHERGPRRGRAARQGVGPDRARLTAALSAMGANVEELPDGWRIGRGQPRRCPGRDARATTGSRWHRPLPPGRAWRKSVELDDPGCVGISYPSFWRDAAALGVDQ